MCGSQILVPPVFREIATSGVVMMFQKILRYPGRYIRENMWLGEVSMINLHQFWERITYIIVLNVCV